MIKICPVGSALRYTPCHRPGEVAGPMAGDLFNDLATRRWFAGQGVQFCDAAEADILVSGTFKGLIKSWLTYGSRKQYLIWTLEPRGDTCFLPQRRYPLLPPIHVLNLYRGLLTDNYSFFPEGRFLRPLRHFHSFDQRPQGRRVVGLMTYRAGRRWRLPYQGKDLDLCNLRTEIAIAAHRENRIDIHGRHWPKGIGSQGDSRGNRNWRNLKLNILGNYHFNLCFENTNWPHYCSEKIWQAIQGGCLPIYYGDGNRIYDDFPADSFIDYAQLASPEALFWFLDELLPQEFLMRYNRCVKAYNLALERHHGSDPRKRLLTKTLAKLEEIAGSSSRATSALGRGSDAAPHLS